MSSIYLGICCKKVGEEGLKLSLDYAEADLALAGGILMPIHFKLAYFKCLPTNGKKKLPLQERRMWRVLGIYSKQYKRLKDIPNGAVMIVSDEAAG